MRRRYYVVRSEPSFSALGAALLLVAEVRAASIAELEALRAREHVALLELAELCELLRARHLVNRFGGPSSDHLRDELWARVQVLNGLDEGEEPASKLTSARNGTTR